MDSSASPTGIFTRVFPVSWFSRFRRPKDSSSSSISAMTNSASGDNKHIAELHSHNFYSMDEQVEDDGAYWRISFSQQGRRSTGGINPLRNYDSESDPGFEFPVSSFKSLDLGEIHVRREEGACPNFNDMVSDIKKMKERLNCPTQSLQDGAMIRRSNDRIGDSLLTNQRRGNHLIGQQGSNSIKLRYRIAMEKEKQLAGFDEGKIRTWTLGKRDVFSVEFGNNAEKQGHVWKPAHSNSRKHVQEIKVKPAECTHMIKRKTKNQSRAKAYSPRSEFKIRALEEMKKARMNNKGAKGQEVKGKTAFDSFAVTKNSYDPQKDFKDSMVEMIREKGIWRREDLEELLASYLTLNRDDYHDLIIKVFRQVWFEIGGVHRSSNVEWQTMF